MRILIYGLNYSPELIGIGKYTTEMAEWLATRGHEVYVICAPPYYPEWQVYNGYSSWRYHTQQYNGVTVHRAPLYIPASPTTIKRIICLFSFALTSLGCLLRLLTWKPDIIFTIVPFFFCAPAAWVYAKTTGAKSWLHVQDFEIDAMFGLGFVRGGGWLSRFSYAIESLILRRFDRVSTISKGMLQRLIDKGVSPDRAELLPNWVDIDFVRPRRDVTAYRDKWGFSPDDKVILYSGNLGKKQGLEIILDAAKHFADQPQVKFIIFGEGVNKAALQQRAQQMSLGNLAFYPLQPYQDLPDLLSMVDIHLVIQRRGAADAVMPSKLTSILSVGGHAVITAEPDTELGMLVTENQGIAKLVEAESATALITGIEQLLAEIPTRNKTGQDKQNYNKIARDYAERMLCRDVVLGRFENKALRLS